MTSMALNSPYQYNTDALRYDKASPFLEIGGVRVNLADVNKDLLDSSKFDYLKNLGTPAADLYKSYGINAPSSVDEASRSLEQDYLKQALEGIDRDTYQSLGAARTDAGDMGLLGAGGTSSIAENALAQVRGQGLRAKAGARTTLGLSELERQKERERATRESLENAANRGFTGNMAFANIANTNQNNYYNQLLNSIFNTYSGETTRGGLDSQHKFLSDQANQQRDHEYGLALLNNTKQDGGWMDQLSKGLGIVQQGVDLGGSIFGKKQLPTGQGGRGGGLF